MELESEKCDSTHLWQDLGTTIRSVPEPISFKAVVKISVMRCLLVSNWVKLTETGFLTSVVMYQRWSLDLDWTGLELDWIRPTNFVDFVLDPMSSEISGLHALDFVLTSILNFLKFLGYCWIAFFWDVFMGYGLIVFGGCGWNFLGYGRIVTVLPISNFWSQILKFWLFLNTFGFFGNHEKPDKIWLFAVGTAWLWKNIVWAAYSLQASFEMSL